MAEAKYEKSWATIGAELIAHPPGVRQNHCEAAASVGSSGMFCCVLATPGELNVRSENSNMSLPRRKIDIHHTDGKWDCMCCFHHPEPALLGKVEVDERAVSAT